MQRALVRQIVDRAPRQERRGQLEQRFRPERARAERVIHIPADAWVADLDEATGVALVVIDEPLSEVEDVHHQAPNANRKSALRSGEKVSPWPLCGSMPRTARCILGLRSPRRPLLATQHDAGVLKRLLPQVLRCFCLAHKELGWPTP